MGVDPLDQGNKSMHGGTQKSSNEIEAQCGWDAARTLLMLKGARIVTNPHTGAAEVAYPTITEDWTELYSNAHVAQLSPALSGLLEAACEDRDASIHYLDKAINMPEFSSKKLHPSDHQTNVTQRQHLLQAQQNLYPHSAQSTGAQRRIQQLRNGQVHHRGRPHGQPNREAAVQSEHRNFHGRNPRRARRRRHLHCQP
eukprot:scaffold193169_cov31-Attheya_sp.AAC.1